MKKTQKDLQDPWYHNTDDNNVVLARTQKSADEENDGTAKSYAGTTEGMDNFVRNWSWGKEKADVIMTVKSIPKEDVLANCFSGLGTDCESEFIVMERPEHHTRGRAYFTVEDTYS